MQHAAGWLVHEDTEHSSQPCCLSVSACGEHQAGRYTTRHAQHYAVVLPEQLMQVILQTSHWQLQLYITNRLPAPQCVFAVCKPGFGNWTNLSGAPHCSMCEPDTTSPGGLSQCTPCPSGTVSGPGETHCVAPPAASTCTVKPSVNTLDTSQWHCPQVKGKNGDVLPGNSVNLPPRCRDGKTHQGDADCTGGKVRASP
jgi:hypothetical protein